MHRQGACEQGPTQCSFCLGVKRDTKFLTANQAQAAQDDGLVPRFVQITPWCCDHREGPLALSQRPVTSGAKGSREFVASPSWLLEVGP